MAADMVASTRVIEELAALEDAAFLALCPPGAASLAPPAAAAGLTLRTTRAPFFLGGRYTKLRRGIPQSPWFIDGERRGDGSVEERLSETLLPALRCASATFSSAGREDVDVRMLGAGRPWALECLDCGAAPPEPAACSALEREVNARQAGTVGVTGLRVLSRVEVAAMRVEDGDKQKSYVAVCWAAQPLTEAQLALLRGTENLVLQQQTPIRVWAWSGIEE